MNSILIRDGKRVTLAPRNFWIGATLVVAVAMILAAGVVPLVRADRVFHATPQMAALVLWIVVGFNLVLAALLAWAALGSARRDPMAINLLGWWAVLSLILVLFLLDPAFGYVEHDNAEMKRAATLLFLCAAIEALGATLALFTLLGAKWAQLAPS